MFESFSIIFTIAALFNYINYKWLKLPTTIGLMILSLVLIIPITISKTLFPVLYTFFCDIIINADFKTLLLDGILSFLLFAGALHVNLAALAKEKKSILLFATFSVLISTFLVGSLVFYGAQLVGLELPFIHALLFGALISPTDPIAVMAILKKANIAKSLGIKIEGESLFNDGIGVVVFSGILLIATTTGEHSSAEIGAEISTLFLEEAVGGLLYGLVIGFLGLKCIQSLKENPQLAVMISLAVVMGGTASAFMLHVSAPLAMVVAGLLIGHKIHINEDKNPIQKAINSFWEILDDVFNGILFVLIGLAIHLLELNTSYILLGILAILIVLFARFVSVFLPYSLLKHKEKKPIKTITILTWGGLRGGISIALALSLNNDLSGGLILHITYIIVLFSIIVQGLSIGKVVKKLYS
ncbi:cation:proton antiporter [Flavivirga spongiicola]|uniref:Sodium:proton antiporter n=1 Tax=Flavivirga spongiicola TaxID=421621 RepID=A0ABU7XXU1_9FLAO|nr:sodium:proton antiporter [Flavivirga sp. MEBiC05379]MDO5980587.1 sodium:proton antiporter [Flavivirga sp. MEBiC05379]